MEKYVDILDFAPPYRLWEFEKFRALPRIGSGTWKNSKPERPPRLLDLEKFKVLPLIYHVGAGTWKNSELCLEALGLEKISGFPLRCHNYRLWD